MDDILKYDKDDEDDYYELLGCDPTSSVDQILAEYRVLAMKLHPDKNPEDQKAAKQFQVIQTAKEVLCDPEKRAKYDKWRESGLAIPFVQWSNSTASFSTTLHWANPETKDRMLQPGGSGSGSGSTSEEKGGRQRRSSDFVSSKWTTEGWQSDKSEVLRKFRNYEI